MAKAASEKNQAASGGAQRSAPGFSSQGWNRSLALLVLHEDVDGHGKALCFRAFPSACQHRSSKIRFRPLSARPARSNEPFFVRSRLWNSLLYFLPCCFPWCMSFGLLDGWGGAGLRRFWFHCLYLDWLLARPRLPNPSEACVNRVPRGVSMGLPSISLFSFTACFTPDIRVLNSHSPNSTRAISKAKTEPSRSPWRW